MIKIAVVIWIVLGASLAGVAMIAVLTIPSLAAEAMRMIPFAVLAGFLVAMPLSFLVARKIARPSAG
ncbi:MULTISPECIES: hypothetical protein [Rhodopseudomonas]|uniref:CTP synthetase n=1 Tax=Rhodopseudomonas palustris TaxID=1076 RepID=A0A0D7ET81_RHOPL|nr:MULTISPECIES: hypothetical protein [Rhodopseudomonas]KIZ43755.1 hypothetical protein OO17_10790 [Rhodopseudomonas palustris]MDF3810804.1 hypothetical protein [Rhodopseudomonas sp. BAL398]WOK17326.1 hypothetical protein RBJ75_24930 [Rhodopseudomonas sp. BAL398]